MKISIITPTADRPHFLEGLYTLIKRQNFTNWEWLVYDTSYKPQAFDDGRVIYCHDASILTIGEKRNRLIQRATGDSIVHFDDDDYYAPDYLCFMEEKLKWYDFFTIHSWFSYDLKAKQSYYWATDEVVRTQFFLHPLMGGKVREIDFGPDQEEAKEKINQKGRFGYGFSYAYKRSLALETPFCDADFGEDRLFYESVLKKGYSIGFEGDIEGRAIHVIHGTNTSGEYPQYRIPRFMMERYHPDFFSYISRYEN